MDEEERIYNIMNKAVFIDRDGTIITEKGYLSDPSGVEILPTAVEGVRLLKEAGFKIAVVTNQSGVGRGYFSLEELNNVHQYVLDYFQKNKASIDKVYFCPHAPGDNCSCRKPKPGMIEQAQQELNIDLSQSYMIGDSVEDIQLGQGKGVLSILVLTGYGEDTKTKTTPDFIAKSFLEAVQWILRNPRKG
jgi:D-glycero-D-manno-heptose 1,7-bisphosphate phosphatase